MGYLSHFQLVLSVVDLESIKKKIKMCVLLMCAFNELYTQLPISAL